jgi:hypothetical protein
MLNQNLDFFISLADELADSFVQSEIAYVVGDAAEGYSSAHDVCRFLVNAAVELANRRQRSILNFDFLVIGPPEPQSGTANDKIWIHLDRRMFTRKIETARAYHPKLAADIEAALNGERFQGIRRFSDPRLVQQVSHESGEMVMQALKSRPDLTAKVNAVLGGVELGAFQVECLRPTNNTVLSGNEFQPFYEIYGERLVAACHYSEVIRYRQHIFPIWQALDRHVRAAS